MGPLVVGVGGCGSLSTLAWAADQAAASGRRVVAVHVMPPAYDVGDLPFGMTSLADDHALLSERLERDLCQVFRLRGVEHRAEVVVGGVLPSLFAVARRDAASILVLGTPRPRLLLGGLSRLVAKAPCSVVFVSREVPLDMVMPVPSRRAAPASR